MLFDNQVAVAELIAGLRGIGYVGDLLEPDYEFLDWFSPTTDRRVIAAAAFGQTPASYESACVGVAITNGLRERKLVDSCRALGAPILLEVDVHEVREWAVSPDSSSHKLIGKYAHSAIAYTIAERAEAWKPAELLRAKNIGAFQWQEQMGLFSGLLPELEEQIQQKLDPLLRETMSVVSAAYSESAGKAPNPGELFQLIFWVLTAKVFKDRKVDGFADLQSNQREILSAVATKYRSPVPSLLNMAARSAAAKNVWDRLDFRNLSVDVLSQIWSTTLVDDSVKKKLGIHRTSHAIVRYITSRLPFNHSGDKKLTIFEPCSGSAGFLVGMMNTLRSRLFGMSAPERHTYFISHLFGAEKDPFGVEISKLALTLADFPNLAGWKIANTDVFEEKVIKRDLEQAGIVLCNPPFENFSPSERDTYKAKYVQKPAELLSRVLDDLNPSGVLGFVLPRKILDGRGYADVRELLAKRFAKLELTVLPDRSFEASVEVVLLLATDPIPHHFCTVTYRQVEDSATAWRKFEVGHEVSDQQVASVSPEEARSSLIIPPLKEIWNFLVNYPRLDEYAELHRGIEWTESLRSGGIETGNREKLVSASSKKRFMLGIAPRTKFLAFGRPSIAYLNMDPDLQRTSADSFAWSKPKAFVNKATRSRGHWRISAIADREGLVSYQTLIGVWPTDIYDETVLTAILNSPIANAFVATREGKTDVTIQTLRAIPMPLFTQAEVIRLSQLVRELESLEHQLEAVGEDIDTRGQTVLREIDALVLDGYKLPPRLERELLEFFQGHHRPVPYPFDYGLGEDGLYFSLSSIIADSWKESTAESLLARMQVDR